MNEDNKDDDENILDVLYDELEPDRGTNGNVNENRQEELGYGHPKVMGTYSTEIDDGTA